MTRDDENTDGNTQYPAYQTLQAVFSGQSTTVGDALKADFERDEPDPDPGGRIIDAITEGRTMVEPEEQVSTLAVLGYSIETTADAVGIDTETAETFAAMECERFAVLTGEVDGEVSPR